MRKRSGSLDMKVSSTDSEEGTIALKFLEFRNELIRSFEWKRLLEISYYYEAGHTGSKVTLHAALESHLSKVVAGIKVLAQKLHDGMEPTSFVRFQWKTMIKRTLENLSSHLSLSFVEDALLNETTTITDNNYDFLDDTDPSEEEIQKGYEDQMWLAEHNERAWSHIEGRVKDYIRLAIQILNELETQWIDGSRPASVIPVVPIKWQGEAQVLAWLLLELADKKWIDVQRHQTSHGNVKEGAINASAFARLVLPHFESIKLGTFEQVFKDGGTSVPLKKWQGFKIPERK